MKLFASTLLSAFIAVVFLVQTTPTEAAARAFPKEADYIKKCIQAEGASQEELEKLKSGQLKLDAASQSAKCFSRCMMEEYGLIDQGVLREAALVDMFTDNNWKENAKIGYVKCKDMKGANECDTALLMGDCLAGAGLYM